LAPDGIRQDAFRAGAVEKNGFTQHDVNTIRIDAEATSIGVMPTDPTINPVVRVSGCGF
jgi:hypothetical protein